MPPSVVDERQSAIRKQAKVGAFRIEIPVFSSVGDPDKLRLKYALSAHDLGVAETLVCPTICGNLGMGSNDQ